MTTLSVNPSENGTIVITPVYTDEDGNNILYTELIDPVWSLIRKTTKEELLTDTISSTSVVLTCSELQIYDAADDGVRVFAIDAKYDSTNGSGLCLTSEVEFTISDMVSQS